MIIITVLALISSILLIFSGLFKYEQFGRAFSTYQQFDLLSNVVTFFISNYPIWIQIAVINVTSHKGIKNISTHKAQQ